MNQFIEVQKPNGETVSVSRKVFELLLQYRGFTKAAEPEVKQVNVNTNRKRKNHDSANPRNNADVS